MNLPGNNSEQVVKLFSIINPYYQRIEQSVDKILQLDSIDLTQLSFDSPLVQEVVGVSALFLGVMDAIVFQYDREAGDRVKSLQRLETVIIIMVLLLLIFVGHFIFRPLVKQVRESYEALRKSEENFRSIFQFVPESLLSVNSQVEVLNFNKAFGILIGKYAPKLKISEAELQQGIISKLKEYFGERKHGIIEISKPHVNKNERLILEFDFAGKVFEEEAAAEAEAIVISLKDITDRKRADEQIKASLKEKEVLLKEIHHRVKNNLQIISSLLDLQSEYIKDEQVLEIFNETQNRIESMALIHEILYQSKDLARIDFAEYIQNLTDSLFSSYAVNFDASKLKVNIQDVLLSPSTAIPCGLIINELVSNSLKHAFPVSSQTGLSGNATAGRPEGKESEIQIKFYSDNYDRKELETLDSYTPLEESSTKMGNKFTLIVSDNGVGFPKDMDFRNTKSLGLQLVNTLTDQLDGTIELNSNNGTEFKIIFTILEKEEFVQNEEERENE